jgi:hypothetical protein
MKFLHISFHKGCQNDIQYVCNQFNITLEYMEFDDGITKNKSHLYNIGHKRANDCWNKYKDYFNSFDAIITSDTAPISRVFLQNNYQKYLIIWVCNRFDYANRGCLDCEFPDQEYYNLIQSAKTRPKTFIIGYTAFENFYAKYVRGVDIGNAVIKPTGCITDVYNKYTETIVENKNNKIFIVPYHNETNMMNLSKKMSELNIDNYCGKYNGPLDLLSYKGVVHIPYAWSNLALFEGLQLGIVYFIPSIKFYIELSKQKNFWLQDAYCINYIKLSEWYCDDFKDVFICFDSWNDLQYKILHTNYEKHKSYIHGIAQNHRTDTLNKWKNIFASITC